MWLNLRMLQKLNFFKVLRTGKYFRRLLKEQKLLRSTIKTSIKQKNNKLDCALNKGKDVGKTDKLQAKM